MVSLLRLPLLMGLASFAAAYFISFPDESLFDQFAHLLSEQINTGFQILAHLTLIGLSVRLRSWGPFLLDLATTAAQTALVQSSKRFLTTDWAIRPSGGYEGFPSGHASATFSLAFLLTLYFPRWWWVWFGMAGLVTWSRVQTNAHTLLQIGAGIVVGIGFAFVVTLIARRYFSLRTAKP